MNCADLRKLAEQLDQCRETDYGTRFDTHCLYPSFEPVSVFISRWGEGYRVTDGGRAVQCAFAHGKDEASLQRAIKEAAEKYMLTAREGAFEVSVENREWLLSAILTVANASALAANIAVQYVQEASENVLKSQIHSALNKTVKPQAIAPGYSYSGASGKKWPIDYAVMDRSLILIKAISPHHVSVNSNYAAYSDIAARDGGLRYSVFDRKLSDDDRALMRQVAELVPVEALSKGLRQALSPSLLL